MLETDWNNYKNGVNLHIMSIDNRIMTYRPYIKKKHITSFIIPLNDYCPCHLDCMTETYLFANSYFESQVLIETLLLISMFSMATQTSVIDTQVGTNSRSF